MKKIIAFLTLTALLLCLGSCGKNSTVEDSAEPTNNEETEKVKETTEIQETTEIEETTEIKETTAETEEAVVPEEIVYWNIGNFVDEFGDPTGNRFMYGVFQGSYSNIYTTDAYLEVRILYDYKNEIFNFGLYENGTQKATYSKNSEMKLLYKPANTIIECNDLFGEAPNDDIWITHVDGDYRGILSDTNDSIRGILMDGRKVPCILYVDNSQYNFTIYPGGFTEVHNTLTNPS